MWWSGADHVVPQAEHPRSTIGGEVDLANETSVKVRNTRQKIRNGGRKLDHFPRVESLWIRLQLVTEGFPRSGLGTCCDLCACFSSLGGHHSWAQILTLSMLRSRLSNIGQI